MIQFGGSNLICGQTQLVNGCVFNLSDLLCACLADRLIASVIIPSKSPWRCLKRIESGCANACATTTRSQKVPLCFYRVGPRRHGIAPITNLSSDRWASYIHLTPLLPKQLLFLTHFLLSIIIKAR